MSRKASQFQKKAMSRIYRGKEIFKPLNTGRIDKHVSCLREWIANIFFYTKNGTTIMIEAGYNYERLADKMSWLDINPSDIKDVLITHQDTDHVGALERYGADGGYSFINVLATNNDLAKQSLGELEQKLRCRSLHPFIITGHTGWTDDLDMAFAHRTEVCNSLRRKPKVHDPLAPYDGYIETEDTEAVARGELLPKQKCV